MSIDLLANCEIVPPWYLQNTLYESEGLPEGPNGSIDDETMMHVNAGLEGVIRILSKQVLRCGAQWGKHENLAEGTAGTGYLLSRLQKSKWAIPTELGFKSWLAAAAHCVQQAVWWGQSPTQQVSIVHGAAGIFVLRSIVTADYAELARSTRSPAPESPNLAELLKGEIEGLDILAQGFHQPAHDGGFRNGEGEGWADGRGGFVMGLLLVRRIWTDYHLEELTQRMVDEMILSLRTCASQSMLESVVDEISNPRVTLPLCLENYELGGKSGIMGVLHSLLCAAQELPEAPWLPDVHRCVDYVLSLESQPGPGVFPSRLQSPTECTTNYEGPWHAFGMGRGGETDFTRGATGAVFLFAKAAEVFPPPAGKRNRYLEATVRAAESVWLMGLRVEELEQSGKPVRRRLGSPRRTSSRTIDAPFQQRWPPKGKEALECDMQSANAPKLERGLLDGIAGNGYALLRTYRATGDVMWARRAGAFARVISEDLLREEKARPVPRPKDAIWKKHREEPWPSGLFESGGVSGVGCFLLDALDPDNAFMPLFELPPDGEPPDVSSIFKSKNEQIEDDE
jgi:hypothetical protein